MRGARRVSVLILCSLWTAGPLLAQAAGPPDAPVPAALDGRWDVQLEGSERSGVIVMELVADGASLSGFRHAPDGPPIPVSGTVRDATVVIEFTVSERGAEIPVVIRVQRKNDRLDGRATLVLPDGREVTRGWSATRSR